MSFASEHPVYCARRGDLKCPASHPGSRHDAMRADKAGWFHSKAEEAAYCPEHVPDWVPVWRARQRQSKRKVQSSFEKQPVTAACEGCREFRESQSVPDDEREAAALLKLLRVRAHDHAYKTGHTVSVTTSQVMTFEAYYEEPARPVLAQ